MFIGRKRELDALGSLYRSDKFEFVVVYGRRRVGKTAMITEFIKGKKAIYFMGMESNSRLNLENFSRAVAEFNTGIAAQAIFPSFQDAFEYVFKISINERIILAIDEYPYVARTQKDMTSILQRLIDKYKDSSKLMLILCGSSMSYMEDNVLAYKAPLYGRRTLQIKLEPFGFEESCRYFKDFKGEEKALAYGIVGGTPQYLLQMDDRLSIEENIKNTYLDPMSFLYEEPVNLLKQEVREPAIYTALITAIAGGASKMSEIAGKVGENTSLCSVYIKSLINLGIIEKETPYGEKESRKTIYKISDNMFRFWYRFVPENMSLIARGASEIALERIKPALPNYMGQVFEEICIQYLWKIRLLGSCPIDFVSLGRWWGNNPKERCQEEIDIMGQADKDRALFAECKWTNEKVDLGILDDLIRRSGIFSYADVHFFLFAKKGFTSGCIERAASMGNVSLVSYDEMIKVFEDERI